MIQRTDMPVAAELDWLEQAAQPPRAASPVEKASEAQIQRAIINLVRRNYPQAIIAHVKNDTGARTTKRKLLARHREGVLAGFPDLITTWPGGRVVFLEVKAARGETSDRQDDVLARLTRQGHAAFVVRGVDEAQAAFRAAGVLTR